MKRVVNILLMTVLLLPLGGCKDESKKYSINEVKAKISEAQYCVKDSDCKIIGDYCDYGCCLAVNRANAGRISKMIENSNTTQCKLRCSKCNYVKCVRNRCETGLSGSALDYLGR